MKKGFNNYLYLCFVLTISFFATSGCMGVPDASVSTTGKKGTVPDRTHMRDVQAVSAKTKDKVGLFFRETNFCTLKLDNTSDALERRFHAGFEVASNWKSLYLYPVAGDFNGDGTDSVGYFVRRECRFFLGDRNVHEVPRVVFNFLPDASWAQNLLVPLLPVMGDWDGDGKDTVGLYRRDTGQFFLKNENREGAENLVVTFNSGLSNSVPVVGDWNNDGLDSLGVYDPVARQFMLSDTEVSGTGNQTVDTIHYNIVLGSGSVYPLAGDWDGDGKDSVGVYRENSGEFWLTNDLTTDTIDLNISHGGNLFVNFDKQSTSLGLPQLYPIAGNWSTLGTLDEDGYEWPTGDPAANGFDPVALDAVLDEAGSANWEHLHSLLVVRHGKLVAERYYRGWDRTMGSNVKSVSKSLISILIGIAVDRGDIGGSDDSLQKYFPDYITASSWKVGITLHDLMTMTAGLEWFESKGNYGHMKASSDWAGFVLDKPKQYEPGTVFNYSTGWTQVGAELLERATGIRLREFAQQNLLGPIGIKATRWDYEPNPGKIGYGHVGVGGHDVYLRPRDMARIGELILRDGILDRNVIVSKSWVDQATTAWNEGVGGYGYWWRVQTFFPNSGPPVDTVNALGWGGQHIIVVPDEDLVVVMTSNWSVGRKDSSSCVKKNFELFSNWIIPALLRRH